ncbi:hypothetical protein SR870_16425 [Rhodopseudomonas palustris]|uniref:hypothetical protein n=1 Tax=Rhodopseudomonas palustris TaxID=1076 RepID=UPI002ACEB839|nr:hypothetical protein [Rhodopseudomonas palustris]WQG98282.1 hypothetical protein SR870_16425 [Rhodopseudomonas palustris]
MLELSIFAVITLAVVYWMALWLMGRREDVLYGSFVSPPQGAAQDQQAEPIGPALSPPILSPPILSPQWPPELPRRPRLATSVPRSVDPTALQHTASAARATAEPPPGDVLASLLETIKRDLSEAAGKDPTK